MNETTAKKVRKPTVKKNYFVFVAKDDGGVQLHQFEKSKEVSLFLTNNGAYEHEDRELSTAGWFRLEGDLEYGERSAIIIHGVKKRIIAYSKVSMMK